MNEVLHEQLSALVDGEIESGELPLLTRQLAQSREFSDQLDRYFVIRDVLKRDLPPCGRVNLAERVSAAVDAEPVYHRRRRRSWSGQALRPAAGLAIAASVAVVAVSLWPGPASTPQGETAQTATGNVAVMPVRTGAMRVSTDSVAAGTPVDEQRPQSPSADQWERLDPNVQHWLNGYMIDHSEHAGSAQLGGVINYARIASHEPKE